MSELLQMVQKPLETPVTKLKTFKIVFKSFFIEFDRTYEQPFETPVGTGYVIKGWDAVLPTMAKGEVAKVLIQSDYAYGDSGKEIIPPKTALIFKIEMIEFYTPKN